MQMTFTTANVINVGIFFLLIHLIRIINQLYHNFKFFPKP